jgi:hypothetical protein
VLLCALVLAHPFEVAHYKMVADLVRWHSSWIRVGFEGSAMFNFSSKIITYYYSILSIFLSSHSPGGTGFVVCCTFQGGLGN